MEVGRWDYINTFTVDHVNPNGVQVTIRRNNVPTIFAQILTQNPINIERMATAILPVGNSIATNTFSMAVEEGIVINPDHTIDLSPQDFGWGDHGQWFNLDGSNNVNSIRRNEQMKALQNIYIAPGAMATLYPTDIVGQTIIVAVVKDGGLQTKTWQTILGFAAFQVTGVGSKSIDGHFLNNFFSPDAIPDAVLGTYYGVLGTPKLVSQ